jgi:TPR repeat protein
MNQPVDLDELYFKALDLQKEGDFVEAFDLLMQCVSLGDNGAQHDIGLAYDAGLGVEKDKAKALFWFKKAWSSTKFTGYCAAIALTYAEIGQQRRAMYWWNKAVALGDGSAALSLAKILMGTDKRKVSKRVIGLLKQAAASEEYVQITVDEKEEAEELLEKLTAAD